LAGRLLGPYWNEVAQKVGAFQFAAFIIIVIVALFFLGRYVTRKELAKHGKQA